MGKQTARQAAKKGKVAEQNVPYVVKEPSLLEQGKDIPQREKRTIRQHVETLKFDTSKMQDPIYSKVNGQEVALVSFLSPFTSQECSSSQIQPKKQMVEIFKKYRIPKVKQDEIFNLIYDELKCCIKIRGCFPSAEAAKEHLDKKIGLGDKIDVYALDLYEYKLVPPNKYADTDRLEVEHADKEVQKYYLEHMKQAEASKLERDQRVENFKKSREVELKDREKNPDKYSLDESKEEELERKLREFQRDSHFNEIVQTQVMSQIREAATRSGVNLDAVIEAIKENEENEEKDESDEEERVEEFEMIAKE